MAISLLSNLSINMQEQNVSRDAFETIADMVAFSENYLPPMFDAYCYEDGRKYRYTRSNDVDPDTGKWRVIGEGGGGDPSLYYTKAQVDSLLDGKVDVETGKGLSDENYTSEEKLKLADLENYDDTALEHRVAANEESIDVLNAGSTTPGSVDSKVASCLQNSKSYTDGRIQDAIHQTAIVCDEKPTISGDTITYYQNGEEKTTTSDNRTKFYYTSSGTNYSTIWIEGTEFTDTLASVDFTDYVSKTYDTVSTYTGDEVDKTKVPTLASMDALKAIVDGDLDDKFDTADIEDSVSSSSGNPVASSVLYSKFAEKVDIAQGTANEGKILKVNDEGNLVLADPSSMGSDAADVTYTNSDFSSLDNVKKALDNLFEKVYYVEPKVNSFTMTPSTDTYEVGSTVSSLDFAWTYNKAVTSQSFTGCTLADETVRSATYSTAFTTNKTFTLTASDGTKTVTSSKSVSFKWKVYWGSAAIPAEFNSSFVLGLSGSKFATSYKGTYDVTVGSGQYGFVCAPSSFNLPSKCKIGGFDTDLINCGTFSITNASGGTTTYKIVRTEYSNLGAIQMVFE